MSEQEILDMQRRIDEGIRLAQQRLWDWAKKEQQSLIVAHEGKVIEFFPK